MTSTSTNGRRIAAALIASAAAVSMAACSSSTKTTDSNPLAAAPSASASAGGPVVIGGNNFPESTLLADIYGGALKAKGVKVSYKYQIGSREISYGLLKNGTITVMPEYNGALLAFLDQSAVPTSSDDTDAKLSAKLATNLTLLNPSPAEDKDSLTVNAETAAKYKLTSASKISDLTSIAGQLTLGAAPEFQTRKEGLLGLKSVYGLTFKSFKALDAGGPLTEGALGKNSIQVGDIFTTDSTISAKKWVTLVDDKGLFGYQNVIPVAQKGALSQAGTDALNAVSAKLDTATLLDLDTKVGGGTDPAAVAQTWLTSVGLG
ncbi:ABC transporter substrate-binding protein [Streptacidiphilus sp. PAMC 29251]